MKHKRKEFKETVNRYLYNRLYKWYLEQDGKISCNYCPYHHMENQDHKMQKSWKKKSKNKKQYKVIDKF